MWPLNSVLLEGTAIDRPIGAGKGKNSKCSFLLSSLRELCDAKGVCISREELIVRVVVEESERVKAALKYVYAGRRLRLVGRLSGSPKENSFCIIAEHLEYRPDLKEE